MGLMQYYNEETEGVVQTSRVHTFFLFPAADKLWGHLFRRVADAGSKTIAPQQHPG